MKVRHLCLSLMTWLATLIHSSNAKRDVVQHLAVDFFIGFGWWLLSADRTASAAYDPVKQLLTAPPYQMRTHGAILVALAIMCTVAIVFKLAGIYAAVRIGLITST